LGCLSSTSLDTSVCVEMDAWRRVGVRFVLPIATVVETGSHVFQVKDGVVCRFRNFWAE